MSRRTLFLLMGLLILVAGGFYYYEYRARVTAWKPLSERVLQSDSLTWVRGGDTVRVTKSEGRWIGRCGSDFAAAGERVQGILSALTQMQCSVSVQPRSSLIEYGLEPPVTELWLHFGAGPEGRLRLDLGGRDWNGTGSYLRVGRERTLHVLPGVWTATVFPAPSELAEKRILPVEVDSVTTFILTHPPAVWTMTRAGEGWVLDGRPMGDSTWPGDFLKRLALYEAREVLFQPLGDSAYGLSPAPWSLRTVASSGEWDIIASTSFEGSCYLRVGGHGAVLKADSQVLKPLLDLDERCGRISRGEGKL